MDMAFAADASNPLFIFFKTPNNTGTRVGLCQRPLLWFGFVDGYVLAYSDSGDEWQHERDFVFVFAICTPNQTVGRYRLRGLI
jgi:hypothetical protein